MFPGTAETESGFSIPKADRDDFRAFITNLSLEGFLYIKQFSILASL